MPGLRTKRVAPLRVKKEVLSNLVSMAAQTVYELYTHTQVTDIGVEGILCFPDAQDLEFDLKCHPHDQGTTWGTSCYLSPAKTHTRLEAEFWNQRRKGADVRERHCPHAWKEPPSASELRTTLGLHWVPSPEEQPTMIHGSPQTL